MTDAPLGFFEVGDTFGAIAVSGGETYQVGINGVTRIQVDKVAGPMGYYAVAHVLGGDGEELLSSHPLHFCHSLHTQA